MNKLGLLSVALLMVALCAPALAQQISGDYVESRSADIYTGPCFANSEVGLTGNEAILGWHIRQGAWNGVRLDGLTIAAAVRAKATLGDPYENPYPAKAVLLVDERATPEQRAALVAFAEYMGGGLLEHVERVIAAPVSLQIMAHHGSARLTAGQFAVVETRAINDGDMICGNEETYYPPLTSTEHAMPAVALTDQYRGPELGESWSVHDKRSAFVGSFAVAGAQVVSAGE